MKNILLLMLLFSGVAFGQNVYIPDSNFKAYLIASNTTGNQLAKNFNDEWIKIDANNDGEIQQIESSVVKYLIIGGQFNDITGIDNFNAIEELDIRFITSNSINLNSLISLKKLSFETLFNLNSLNINNLTNLNSLKCNIAPNLNALNITNLTNLTYLNCSNTSINTLNINNQINLTELICSSNQLTNLNGLSNQITKLNCSGNLLTSLNLSSLINLTELNCSGNSLNSLTGISHLTKLNCNNNLLSNLNVSSLTNLTELGCSGNQIINLNVSALTNLTFLNCENNLITTLNVNTLTNLTALGCSNNQLISIDVNSLSNLTILSCASNKLTTFSLNGLTNLTTLECSYNNDLTSIALSNLPNLQEFKILSSTGINFTTLSHLTSLILNSLPSLQKLDCSNGILTTLNLSFLNNLTELNCSSNKLTTLDLGLYLPNLKKLNCRTNPITSLDLTGLTQLQELSCGGDKIGNQYINQLSTLNFSGLINLKTLNCNGSLLTTLDVSELSNLEVLYCGGISDGLRPLISLNVNGLINLKYLYCAYQQLTSLSVVNLTNLIDLNCSNNFITDLDLTGLSNLQFLNYNYNNLSNLNLVNLPSLTFLNCGNNSLVTLNIINLTNLITLDCSYNQLTTLNLSGLNSLENLNFSNNQISFSNLNGLSTSLKRLTCYSNNLTSLNVNNLTNLTYLLCSNNSLTNLDVSNLINLETLEVKYNLLTSLNLVNLNNLKQLSYGSNLIPNLDVSFLTNLTAIDCSNTQTTSLNLNNLLLLDYLDCSNNLLSTLNVAELNNLQLLDCYNNQLTTIDLSNCHNLQSLLCFNNQLTTLFIKNGMSEYLAFNDNPNLQYICADEQQLESIQTQLNNLNMNTTVSNSYCSFTPGGNHNTITGITVFDANNNGCEVTDVVNPFIRLDINDGISNGATVTNINGTYSYYTNAGNYDIEPNVENPSWFNFSPLTATVQFNDNNNNISNQSFCIAGVGIHNDIEIVISQNEVARPGFNAKYKIVYKNKGNTMQSGTVNLQFDDAKTDFVNANPSPNNINFNNLQWNYINLMPFENRSIEFTLNINSPTETPAVNIGNILNFNATISSPAIDELPLDNQFNYNQVVLGSYDPNDIICLEGEVINPSEIGNYLHYNVNFENTGTFYAENVVVKVEIDQEKFDINTLQMLNSSNPSTMQVKGNKVEFIFQNINLAAVSGNPPVGGHGDILFKIKTKNSLVNNDSVVQNANIYFDYNFPILTTDAISTFTTLNNTIFEVDTTINIYPNPTNSIINIKCKNTISSIELYDIQGRLLETSLENKSETKIDISSKQNGVYFLKITSEKGSAVEKIIKE